MASDWWSFRRVGRGKHAPFRVDSAVGVGRLDKVIYQTVSDPEMLQELLELAQLLRDAGLVKSSDVFVGTIEQGADHSRVTIIPDPLHVCSPVAQGQTAPDTLQQRPNRASSAVMEGPHEGSPMGIRGDAIDRISWGSVGQCEGAYEAPSDPVIGMGGSYRLDK